METRQCSRIVAFVSAALLCSAQIAWQYNINFIGKSFGIPGNATFDYIVIGGGTGGNAVATRLAQHGGFSVAVIEAGGFYEIDNGNASVIPYLATQSIGPTLDGVNPRIDWLIETTPQAELKGARQHYARGKCLGGSSARNFFVYHHGTKGSYQKWAELAGDESYEYGNFRKYYQRSTHYNPGDTALRPANSTFTYTGPPIDAGGPVQVSSPSYIQPFAMSWAKGLEKIGMPKAPDFVNGKLDGVAPILRTIDPKDATRSSSETSYLRLALQGTGLIVYHYTLAKKIVFEGNRASGVQVVSSGLSYTLKARKEVILAAGAFQSPQLLMVSGIGPHAVLAKHGIPVLAEKPGVGQDMQDHVMSFITVQTSVVTASELTYNATFAAEAQEQYVKSAAGIFTTPISAFAGWEKLPRPQRDALSPESQRALAAVPSDWPELEYLAGDSYIGPDMPANMNNYAALAIALVAPQSRGTVTISSASTSDLPVVDPQFLSSKVDQEMFVAGFKRLREALQTPTLRDITVGEEVFPGRNVSSDAAILEYLRNSARTVWHASCTCKMGKADDPMAVVDSRARVYGVKGLRVVDASSFPLLMPGHPSATVYAFAEKIAEDIILRGSDE